jgi:hypothetical protein
MPEFVPRSPSPVRAVLFPPARGLSQLGQFAGPRVVMTPQWGHAMVSDISLLLAVSLPQKAAVVLWKVAPALAAAVDDGEGKRAIG